MDAERERDLTEALVNALADRPEGATVMDLAIALRVPYPRVASEIEELARLGVVLRARSRTAVIWKVG